MGSMRPHLFIVELHDGCGDVIGGAPLLILLDAPACTVPVFEFEFSNLKLATSESSIACA